MKIKYLRLVALFITSLLIIFLPLGGESYYSIENDTNGLILYVKPSVAGNCLSWSTACDLITAIDIAGPGSQIWVASGIYRPTHDVNRDASFILTSGVEIFGGFPVGGGDWSSRDWTTNVTALSGEIGSTGNSDNSYHVVSAIQANETAILDGFNIIKGNANTGGNGDIDNPRNHGGGLYISSGSPTLRNIIFSDNAAQYGGAISIESGFPNIYDLTISNNTAEYQGGGIWNKNSSPILSKVQFSTNSASWGGGMFNEISSPVVEYSIFDNNSAISTGGGVNNHESSPVFRDVTFTTNSAHAGGGMYNNFYSYTTLFSVLFNSNTAGLGGGMANDGNSVPGLENVTFSGNVADQAGAIHNSHYSDVRLTNVTITGNVAESYGGAIVNFVSSPLITNSIIWGNSPDQVFNLSGTATITYSDIEDGYEGVGNIDTNPKLGELALNGGFTLTHAIGDGSPVIDTGDPNNCPVTDQRGFTRPVDGDRDGYARCDMGAYEYATYTLNVEILGDGMVSINPDKTEYFWDDDVILTPTAEPGWIFSGWGGDASGSDNPLLYTIVDNTTIVAYFTQTDFFLYLPLILK